MPFGWGSKGPSTKRIAGQEDALQQDDLVNSGEGLQCEAGVPYASDSCAYEPIQKLLAIGTADGRVKLFGKAGVESTVRSAARVPLGTRQLEFVHNRALLLRVSEGGFLETWNVASSRTHNLVEGSVRHLQHIKLEGDTICCVAVMSSGDPFLLLGCGSGALRFAAIVSDGGDPAQELRQAQGIRLLSYRVPCDVLKGSGELVEVAAQSFGWRHLVLARHENHGVALWDLRSQTLRAALHPRAKDVHQPALKRAGKITSMSWLSTGHSVSPATSGGAPGCKLGRRFATGHELGDVLVWSLPPFGDQDLSGGPTPPSVVATIRITPGPDRAAPILSLRHVRGRKEGLLVLGGQESDQPDSIAMLSLPPSLTGTGPLEGAGADSLDSTGTRGKPTITKLPFYGQPLGFASVPAPGALTGNDDPAGILQLLEGGQPLLHDMASGTPIMLSMPLQGCGQVTCTGVYQVPGTRQPNMPSTSMNMSTLRRFGELLEASGQGTAPASTKALRRADSSSSNNSSRLGGAGTSAAASKEKEMMALVMGGGIPPKPPAEEPFGTVFCTGHKDGRVRVWDLASVQPRLLAIAPSHACASTKLTGQSLRTCTAIDLVWQHGMLLTGHTRGEVRLYQLGNKPRTIDVLNLRETGAEAEEGAHFTEDVGMQIKLRSHVHEAEISALSYCAETKMVAVGDKSGSVSVIDLSLPSVLWLLQPTPEPVVCVQLASVALPSKRDRAPGLEADGSEGTPHRAVLVANADACISALSVDSGGCYIGKGGELRPKNLSQALCFDLLDADFNPLWLSGMAGEWTQEAAAAAAGAGIGGARRGSAKAKAGKAGAAAAAKGRRRHASEDEDEDGEGEGWSKRRGTGTGKGAAGKRKPTGQDTQSEASDNDSEDEGSGGRGKSKAKGKGSRSKGPLAEHLLLATDAYIRIYSIKHVIAGERTSTAKISNATPLIFAAPFHVNGAPGLVTLAQREGEEAVLQVYSLPGLEMLMEEPVSQVLGGTLSWDPPEGSVHKVQRMVSCSRLGHLMLLGPGHELLRVAVAAGLPQPAMAPGIYDWEVAVAAASAAAAAERALFESRNGAPGELFRRRVGQATGAGAGEDSEGLEDGDEGALEGGGEGAGAQEGKPGGRLGLSKDLFVGALNKVQQGMTKAFEGTTKGLTLAATTVAKGVEVGVKEVGKLFVDEGPDAYTLYNMQYPDLGSVLAQDMPEPPVKGVKARRARGREPEDGIPFTQPQRLILPSTAGLSGAHAGGTGSAAAGRRGSAGPGPGGSSAAAERTSTAASSSAAAGGPAAPSPRKPTAGAGQRHQRHAHKGGHHHSDSEISEIGSGSGKSEEEDEDAPGAWRRKKAAAETSAGGRGFGAAGGAGGGLAAAASRRHTRDEGQAEERPQRRQDKNRRGTYDDDDGLGSSDEGGGGGRKGGPNIQLDQVKAKLLGGAQKGMRAIVGAVDKLGLRGDDDDDEDDGYGGGRRSNRDDPARDREALGLGGPGGSSRRYGTAAADPFPSTAPRFRSANEIKQSYGRGGGAAGTTSTRDVTGRSQQVRDVVEQTRAKLEERGERLRQLDEKAADLNEGAAGFADLARQLADAQRNRKWWQ